MNALLQTHMFLSQALSQDDLSALALLTVWLDPLWIGVSEPNELDPNYQEYGDDDPKLQALLIARRCFPELYVEAISQLHQGCTALQLEETLCEGFTQAGIPLDEGGWSWSGGGYLCQLMVCCSMTRISTQIIPMLCRFWLVLASHRNPVLMMSSCRRLPILPHKLSLPI